MNGNISYSITKPRKLGILCLPERIHLPQLLPDWSYISNISYFHYFSTDFFIPTWIPFSLVQIPISSHLDYCNFYLINLFPDWPVFLQIYPTDDNLVCVFLVELILVFETKAP